MCQCNVANIQYNTSEPYLLRGQWATDYRVPLEVNELQSFLGWGWSLENLYIQLDTRFAQTKIVYIEKVWSIISVKLDRKVQQFKAVQSPNLSLSSKQKFLMLSIFVVHAKNLLDRLGYFYTYLLVAIWSDVSNESAQHSDKIAMLGCDVAALTTHFSTSSLYMHKHHLSDRGWMSQHYWSMQTPTKG